MIYFRIQENSSGKILAGNMQEFLRVSEFENRKNFSEKQKGVGLKGVFEIIGDVSVWIVAENERDLLMSSKVFKQTFSVYRRVAVDIWRYYKQQITAYAHILNTIQSQVRQKIEEFAGDKEFFGETYNESLQKISNIIENDGNSAADLICYVHKRIADMRAHLLGTEIMYFGAQDDIRLVKVRLKRAILNQCTPFLDELNEKMIRLKFFFDENCTANLDKNMFSLVMYNFFSNAVKYTRQNSEIRLHYSSSDKTLDISMISLKMERNEINDLFTDGVRGKHASHLPGNGIGLFVLQRALTLMRKSPMYIKPNYQENFSENGSAYNENHFQFFL